MRLARIRDYYFIILAVILAVLFFYPALISNKTFWFRDIHKWFYPMKYFLATSLQNGNIPFWCPNYYCGSPFMSDLQSGVFYPLSFVFAVFSFPLSFNIYIILHIIMGFCFFYLFIKGMGLSTGSAIITSISYCYGSYTIATINTLNNLSTLIWLPAILWSFQRAKSRGRKSGFFLTVLFLCMSVLGGEPQLFVLSTVLLFSFGLFCVSEKTAGIKSVLRENLLIGALICSALLISFVQLRPTYVDYQHSIRLGGVSYGEATGWSLNFEMLKHFFIPLPFRADFTTDPSTLTGFFPGNGKMPWLLTIYPGFLIAPAALFSLFFGFSRKILLWLTVFFVTLILALGDSTPTYYIFYKIFPFFRYPAKFFFLTGFSLLVMAAYGFDRIISFLKQKGGPSDIPFLFIALILVADLYTTHRHLNPLTEPNFYQYYHPSLKPVFEDKDEFRVYFHDEFSVPTFVEDTVLNRHIRVQMFLIPNLGILHGVHQVTGTSPLELRYQYVMAEILMKKSWQEKIQFLRLANVKYIITSYRLDRDPESKDQVERLNPFLYRIKGFLPRAWIVGRLIPINKGTGEELIDGSFDPFTSALAKGDVAVRYNEPSFERISRIAYTDNSKIHIELTAKKPGVLVLSESSYPGWKVFVDGKEESCLWLNLLFQGVEVGKGKHQIDFVFRPEYFGISLTVSICSLSMFLFLWICFRLSEKKHFQQKDQ